MAQDTNPALKNAEKMMKKSQASAGKPGVVKHMPQNYK